MTPELIDIDHRRSMRSDSRSRRTTTPVRSYTDPHAGLGPAPPGLQCGQTQPSAPSRVGGRMSPGRGRPGADVPWSGRRHHPSSARFPSQSPTWAIRRYAPLVGRQKSGPPPGDIGTTARITITPQANPIYLAEKGTDPRKVPLVAFMEFRYRLIGLIPSSTNAVRNAIAQLAGPRVPRCVC